MSIFWLQGCETINDEYFDIDTPRQEQRQGIYHKVKRGETLWRIAKTYDISIHAIIQNNNIPQAGQVKLNQLIFIPGAVELRSIVLDHQEADKDFIWPVRGNIIGYFHERNAERINKGIDIEVRQGQIVQASRTGRVVFADYLSGYEHTVILDHSDGYYTVYAQNARLLVETGDLVLKSSPISQISVDGHLAYLHFEIRKNSIEYNPLYYLP